MKRLLLTCALALTIGCRAQSPSPVPASEKPAATGSAPASQAASTGPPRLAVELPDISAAAAPVQAQLRERFASLQQQLGQRDTTPAALAAAYSDLGRLLMATEFLDPAERFFRNARALEPGEMRWPY